MTPWPPACECGYLATAEKHYTVRPLDLLRLHHEKFEAWVLEQGGVLFVREANPRRLKIA